MEDTRRLFSSAFLKSNIKYLLRTEAFRSQPFIIAFRGLLWGLYSCFNYSPTFYLTPKGGRLKVVSNIRHIGASSAFIYRDCVEPELKYLDQLLSPGDLFIDCGANIGIFTIKAATLVGQNGIVIAIEPGAESISRLRDNIALNGFTNVRVIEKVLSDEEGMFRLYHTGGGPVAYSLVGFEGVEFEEVQAIPLDKLIKEYSIDRLDCLKIDVEGAEPLVISGALESIRRYRPKIIFEINSAGTRRSGRKPSTAWDMLRKIGYDFYYFKHGVLLRLSDFPTASCNVVAIPS